VIRRTRVGIEGMGMGMLRWVMRERKGGCMIA
jgi:hypothetical protein